MISQSQKGKDFEARCLFNENQQCNINRTSYLKSLLPFEITKLIIATMALFCILFILFGHFHYLKSNSDLYSITSDVDSIIMSHEKFKKNFVKFEDSIPNRNVKECNRVTDVLRFDCHPENGASESSCANRGCCWNPSTRGNGNSMSIPTCYYPTNWNIYSYANFTQDGNDFSGLLKLKGNSYYPNDLKLIEMKSFAMDATTLRVKIFDPSNRRYEPPWPIIPDSRPSSTQQDTQTQQYKFLIDEEKSGFQIQRTNDNNTIFDSIGMGAFIFADQFLQMSAVLPTNNVYGLGEHKSNLKLDFAWQTFTMFNKDGVPVENANLYGSHPFYLMIEESGDCHGVLFLNSNAMEFILQPTPAITFRTIGGIFDMYFFMGPTPAEVLKQYSKVVGKPFLPPYWSLGFHLCRYGYGTLEKTKQVWNRTRAAGIPFDTQWNDLDYMDKNNDFTVNKTSFKDLPQFVEELHAIGMHYIPLIDAGISASEVNGSYVPYEEGLRQDIFIKSNESNVPFMGKVWNLVSTTWPDFTHPNAKDYYLTMMKNTHEIFAYDGAWIDMNEPSNFYNGYKNGCPKNHLDNPPYVPRIVGNLLSTLTVCMNAKHHIGYHYDLHNTYGTSQAIATHYALMNIRKKRPFIISRSTWEGHGYYAGHWTGDVYSTWYDLEMSVPAILSFGLFQVPMVGADICGFNGNTTAELCNRWMQLGAFYPFARNHNSDDTIEQDPVAMGDLVVKSSIKALRIRYSLLPYLYTLFYRAHRFGETVARPLFFEFVEDPQTYTIDRQFLWGKSLMIVPVVEQGKTQVSAYIPRGLWYNYYTKAKLFSIGKIITLEAPLDTIPLMIRGGSILPTQQSASTTTESRKNPFDLLVALNRHESAFGELYWDDGDSLDSIEKEQFLWLRFSLKNQTLTSHKMAHSFFEDRVSLGSVWILGIERPVSKALFNNKPIDFKYDTLTLALNLFHLEFDMRNEFRLNWEYR